MSSKRLRLILGDQLNAGHSWYKENPENTLYVIAELHQEASYTQHHIQKVSAFFAAMQAFALALKQQGFHVLHLTLDDTQAFDSLATLICALLKAHHCQHFDYQRPDEKRLLKQLRTLCNQLAITSKEYDTEHFLLPFDEISNTVAPEQHNRMESFYRMMRKRFGIMMEDTKPWGKQWNYDQDNRNKLKAADIANIPEPLLFSNDVSAIVDRITRHNIATLGTTRALLPWPVTRQQGLQLLQHFCQYCLPRFGRFQDAMTANSPHAWSLYHSRLSFALNTKMLHPLHVIQTAIDAYQQQRAIDLAQLEGFVRQILGWREYVRAVYWANADHYDEQNALNATTQLPHWFWTGNTQMRCMQQCITQSLTHAYAHHIQRLMITGNFCLIAGIDPAEVEAWYLGIYIDAIEWVEQPNTRSMALFADNGWVATKPYAASANYINKMSDYCKGCHYSPKERLAENACPFNALYWQFLIKHQHTFRQNTRMAFSNKQAANMSEEQRIAIRKKADTLIQTIETL